MLGLRGLGIVLGRAQGRGVFWRSNGKLTVPGVSCQAKFKQRSPALPCKLACLHSRVLLPVLPVAVHVAACSSQSATHHHGGDRVAACSTARRVPAHACLGAGVAAGGQASTQARWQAAWASAAPAAPQQLQSVPQDSPGMGAGGP